MKIPILGAGLIASIGIATAVGQQAKAESTPTRASAADREKAFAAMLEGQRYMWLVSRTRSQAVMATNASLAKSAFARAVETDPSLAEAYTAMAELAIVAPPGDSASAIDLAKRAVKIDPDNIGAHRILARLYTFGSGLNTNQFNAAEAALAVAEWKEVARIDPRNPEAWAFLAELHDELKQPAQRVAALRQWLAASQPVDVGFYRRVMGGAEDLRPEAASIKLGIALTNAGEFREAVETLSIVIADAPDNTLALEYLAKALVAVDARTASLSVQPLQQAAFGDPTNLTLVRLLAEAQVRSGRTEDAVGGLTKTAARLLETDRNAAASVEVVLGDIYAGARRVPEAVTAYEKALKTRAIGGMPVASTDRDFAILVFGKIIEVYRAANRLADANAVRDRARRLLDTADLFAS